MYICILYIYIYYVCIHTCMYTCLRRTLLILDRDRLCVTDGRIFVSFEVVLSFSFKTSFQSIFSTAFICFFY